MAHTRRSTHKSQPAQDNCEAGPSGLMQEKKDKSKEDETSCHSGMFVQQKVNENRTKGSSEKEKVGLG